MSDEDYFDDVPEARALGGIFTGNGLQTYNSVPTDLKQDGLWVTTRCEFRGDGRKINIDWYSLVAIAMEIVPESTGYWRDPKNGTIRTRMMCSCNIPWPFGLTPQECQSAVKRGVSYRYLSQQAVDQLAARAQQERQQQIAQGR